MSNNRRARIESMKISKIYSTILRASLKIYKDPLRVRDTAEDGRRCQRDARQFLCYAVDSLCVFYDAKNFCFFDFKF